ncbi:MAG: GTP-binding protein [Candidatus Omnitrophica bacterium]|nr:GTP-binding protein [Candidatus Omnitrophota bacterium]
MREKTDAPKMDRNDPIPVTVVAGFLGAGKTTLLNHILHSDHGRRIAVLVNDFSAINIDAELISEVSESAINLTNGCICCTIRMDLIGEVLRLADLPEPPEHIVIESSGVADPAGIVRSFFEQEVRQSALLDAIITVVDSELVLELSDEEDRLAQAQILGGDLFVLNKIDLVDEVTLQKVRDWMTDLRPGVPIFETVKCQAPVESILGFGRTRTNRFNSDAKYEFIGLEPHPSFETWTYISETPMAFELLQQVLTHLPKSMVRAKGFIYSNERRDRRLLFQLVGRRATISDEGKWGEIEPQTRLVFIARKGSCNFPAIEKALDACQAKR